MFKKLNITFDKPEYNYGTLISEYGYALYEGQKKFKIGYHFCNDYKEMYNVIPEQYRKYFNLEIMDIYGSVTPHIDNSIKATINFYLQTGNAETVFYDLIDENGSLQIKNNGNGYVFTLNSLKKVSSFIANDNDVYILDTSKPHSVNFPKTNPNGYRTAIILQTKKFTYEQVLDMLKETNSI